MACIWRAWRLIDRIPRAFRAGCDVEQDMLSFSSAASTDAFDQEKGDSVSASCPTIAGSSVHRPGSHQKKALHVYTACLLVEESCMRAMCVLESRRRGSFPAVSLNF